MNYRKVAGFFGAENIGQVRFAHAVNSQTLLEKYLDDPSIHVLEGDISLSEEEEIIMAHPPATASDLKFSQWLDRAIKNRKGVKLDFKTPKVVGPCLRELRNSDLKDSIVILNADILVGPGGSLSPFDSFDFIRRCQQIDQDLVLSLGWRTRLQEGHDYSTSTVEKMLELTKDLPNLVTFPIRAFYLRDSWNNLQKLLEKPNYSLTLWNNEPIEPALVSWIKENLDPARTFFDLIHYPNGSPLMI